MNMFKLVAALFILLELNLSLAQNQSQVEIIYGGQWQGWGAEITMVRGDSEALIELPDFIPISKGTNYRSCDSVNSKTEKVCRRDIDGYVLGRGEDAVREAEQHISSNIHGYTCAYETSVETVSRDCSESYRVQEEQISLKYVIKLENTDLIPAGTSMKMFVRFNLESGEDFKTIIEAGQQNFYPTIDLQKLEKDMRVWLEQDLVLETRELDFKKGHYRAIKYSREKELIGFEAQSTVRINRASKLLKIPNLMGPEVKLSKEGAVLDFEGLSDNPILTLENLLGVVEKKSIKLKVDFFDKKRIGRGYKKSGEGSVFMTYAPVVGGRDRYSLKWSTVEMNYKYVDAYRPKSIEYSVTLLKKDQIRGFRLADGFYEKLANKFRSAVRQNLRCERIHEYSYIATCRTQEVFAGTEFDKLWRSMGNLFSEN